MNITMYAVKDLKTQSFAKPFADVHDMQAVRGFIDVCQQKDTYYYKYPADYELWKLAGFNDDTGTFLDNPSVLIGGVAAKGTRTDDNDENL